MMCNSCIEEGLGSTLYSIGLKCARQLGLRSVDAEDCAMEFVLKMLRHDSRCEPGRGTSTSSRWTYRCAMNHTRNFHRAVKLRQRRHCEWPFRSDTEGEGEPGDWPALQLSQDAYLLNGELWSIIENALTVLPTYTRLLFIDRYIHDMTIERLALFHGCSTNAIEQALLRARRRLKKQLVLQGYNETEIRDYLCITLAPGIDCPRQ